MIIIETKSVSLQCLFGRKKEVSEDFFLINMKSTKSGFSGLSFLLGVMTVLLMVTGSSMAAPLKSSVGPISPGTMKAWIHAQTIQLSNLIGTLQEDFASDRLGNKNNDDYYHKIPGLPRPVWNQDRIPEQLLLEKDVEQLFAFRTFITLIKTKESQNKSSRFKDRFGEIEREINVLIREIHLLETLLGYKITNPPSSPQPTGMPTTTQKEQDAWKLGVLKEFLYWLIPVQGYFHQPAATA